LIHNLPEVFEELDHRERKELLRTVINKMDVERHQLECQIFALPKSFVDYGCTVRSVPIYKNPNSSSFS